MNSIDTILHLVVVLSVLTIGTSEVNRVNDYSAALRRELFDPTRYDQFSSPYKGDHSFDSTLNASLAVHIHISLLVLHVHDLDELTGTLTTNAWLLAFWNDYRLRWKPEDYGNVVYIHTPFTSIWLPELALINDVEAMVMKNLAEANVVIYEDGTVYWGSPVTFKSACYIDHKYYPFDEHSCTMAMRIWSMPINHYIMDVNYIAKGHEDDLLTHFGTDNPLWEVKSRKSEISYKNFSCCPESPFPLFEATLAIRRRAPLFKYILITPGLISILLTLALFWLPPSANAKIRLGGVVVGIQIAMLLFLGWRIPPGGKSIPAIVLLCGNTLVMATLAVVIAVLVIRISKTPKETAIPEWLKFLTRDPYKGILCLGNSETQVWARFVAKVGFANKDKGDAELIDSEGMDIDHTPKPDGTAAPNWLLIGTAIDRLCFIIYCFIMGLIIITSFS